MNEHTLIITITYKFCFYFQLPTNIPIGILAELHKIRLLWVRVDNLLHIWNFSQLVPAEMLYGRNVATITENLLNLNSENYYMDGKIFAVAKKSRYKNNLLQGRY